MINGGKIYNLTDIEQYEIYELAKKSGSKTLLKIVNNVIGKKEKPVKKGKRVKETKKEIKQEIEEEEMYKGKPRFEQRPHTDIYYDHANAIYIYDGNKPNYPKYIRHVNDITYSNVQNTEDEIEKAIKRNRSSVEKTSKDWRHYTKVSSRDNDKDNEYLNNYWKEIRKMRLGGSRYIRIYDAFYDKKTKKFIYNKLDIANRDHWEPRYLMFQPERGGRKQIYDMKNKDFLINKLNYELEHQYDEGRW